MQPKRLKYLFNGYLSGTLTSSENKEWLNFAQDSKNRAALRQLIDEVAVTDVPAREQSPEKAESIFSHIVSHREAPVALPLRRTMVIKRLAVAASILLVAGLLVFRLSRRDNGAVVRSASTRVPENMMQSVAEKRRYIVLADGSRVILNQRSTLSHPASFDNGTREVYLTGEGYFDISHDDHKPFIVHTGKLTITVLGTAFNIKAYKDQPNIAVTVTQGKVKVENDRHSLGIVTPNQQIMVDAGSGEVKQATVDAEAVTQWQRKELIFDDMPLDEVVVALKMRFNVTVDFADQALKKSRITASFINNEPLEQVLEVITKVNKIRYSLKDNHVLISGDSQN
ncbi:MAG: FecR domain-containing protein [Chitinophagaceae bacterium]|nr:FecR domain-containing protein [Chitinophagaceae bacterium]